MISHHTCTSGTLSTRSIVHHVSRIHKTPKNIYIPLTLSTPSPHRPNSTSAIRITHNTRVNGPSTTLPAPLVLPERAPSEKAVSFYFKLGKGYLTFYKTGLRNVWANFQASRTLRKQINTAASGSVGTAVSSGLISRSDFQLLVRSWHDSKRIPPFALVFMVCGEFTPLVVLFMSGVVPRTCRIPKQILADREAVEVVRRASFRELVTDAPRLEEEGQVGRLSREQLLHISRSLALYSRWWPEQLGIPTDGMLRRSIGKSLNYLEMDDELIERDGGVGQMEIEEVRMACVERGVDVLGKNDQQLRMLLRGWLWGKKRGPVTRLLLTRPSVWPKKDQ
ncbi:MAG: hypothetical protein M1827_000034 [Pycnora praestabilis]|nr:MAG: hypothetical protein M1827_000034 [Pycnora praestabilis]